ncbi:MAG TPA: DMT family transporter [Streptosporangiaceae bacterium]|nr:DMT family transporter [Streptosporangiaceae bacterium]
MPARTVPPIAAALAGAVCISSSAVVMKLAATSASLTALGRCVFALPVLGALVFYERRRGALPLPRRSRWLARLAGAFLAADLIVWSHTIDAIGAGLGTVVTNLEVLIISLLAWLFLGERPRRSLVLASPVMLAGLVLVGGLADFGGARAYGTDPSLGVGLGMAVAFLYAIYILTLRQATFGQVTGETDGGPRPAIAAPLFETTLGAAVTAAVLGLVLQDFRLGPAWPTLGWLALLALTSQVIGWLLITVSMPRLPAGLIGALLLVQPAGSVALSYLVLGERPSALQLAGVLLILTGVLVAVGGRAQATVAAEGELAAAGSGGDGYSRRSTRIIRQASAASTGASASKSP